MDVKSLLTPEEISMDGFQVVSKDLFAHMVRTGEPACTLWSTAISFSKAAVQALNNCDRIRIQVNPKLKCLLIVPVTGNDKDAIRWTKNIKDPSPRRIFCIQFTDQLFETWGWEKNRVYRTSGKIVTADRKVMMLFDFSNPTNWEYNDMAKTKQ